jgi:hypothetical protein
MPEKERKKKTQTLKVKLDFSCMMVFVGFCLALDRVTRSMQMGSMGSAVEATEMRIQMAMPVKKKKQKQKKKKMMMMMMMMVMVMMVMVMMMIE